MTIAEGQRPGEEDYARLPLGTVLHDGYGREATLVDTGFTINTDGGVWAPFALRSWQIRKVGDWTPTPMNLATFKQRAHTTCYGSALQHGVPVAPVREALRQIGTIETPPLGVGMYVHSSDTALRERLTRKHNLVLGYGNPNQWESYAEFNGWGGRARIGGQRLFCYVSRVLHMDDPDTDVYLQPPAEEDEQEIARLRGVIWQIGTAAKRRNRWCEAYENAVSSLGVGPHAVTEVTASQPEVTSVVLDPEAVEKPIDGRPVIYCTRDNVAAYPVGAVFEYPGSRTDRSPDYRPGEESWNWSRRTDHRPEYLTENFIGPNGGATGGHCRVLWDGRGDMAIPVYRDLLPHLPIGTLLCTAGREYWWKKVAHNPGGHEWCRSDSTGHEAGGAEVGNDGFVSSARGTSSWVIGGLPNTWRHGAACAHPNGQQW